jgi:large repetitive protein
VADDNCSVAVSVVFEITGATTRSGIGIDASGNFNSGQSIINWSATDDCGNTINCSSTINIAANAIPAFDPIGALCLNSTAPILPLTSNNGITGTWNPSIINTSVTGTTTYTFTPDIGTCTESVTIDIVINPLPVVTINPVPPMCSDVGTVTLSGTPAGGVFSGNGVTGITFDPKVAGTGTHTITYTYTDANGCSNSATTDILVHPIPNLIITDPASVCQPNRVDLTAASVTAGSDSGLTLTYWRNAGATTPLANPSAVAVSNIYYIKAVNSNGCSVIKPVTVTISQNPILIITDPAAVCSPATVDITRNRNHRRQ